MKVFLALATFTHCQKYVSFLLCLWPALPDFYDLFLRARSCHFLCIACQPGLRVCLARVSLCLSFLSFSPSESFLIKRANRIRVKLSVVEGATSACHTKKWFMLMNCPHWLSLQMPHSISSFSKKQNSLSCQLQVNTIRQVIFFSCCSLPDMTRSDSNKGMRR